MLRSCPATAADDAGPGRSPLPAALGKITSVRSTRPAFRLGIIQLAGIGIENQGLIGHRPGLSQQTRNVNRRRAIDTNGGGLINTVKKGQAIGQATAIAYTLRILAAEREPGVAPARLQ